MNFTISQVAQVIETRPSARLAGDLLLANRYARQNETPRLTETEIDAFIANPEDWASRYSAQYTLLRFMAEDVFATCQSTGNVIVIERGGKVVKMPTAGRPEQFKAPQVDYSKRDYRGPVVAEPAKLTSAPVEAEQARLAGRTPRVEEELLPTSNKRRKILGFGGQS